MKINVGHIAKLANLKLTDSETKTFEKQLEETLIYIESLNEVSTDKIDPTNHVTGLENITRKDEASPSLSQDEALKNAKSKHNGMFKVKGILENES